MRPRSTGNDAVNSGMRDTILSRHARAAVPARHSITDIAHLSDGESGVRIAFTAKPALGNTIAHVVAMCAKKQVSRIDARRVVAFVEDMQAVRDSPVC